MPANFTQHSVDFDGTIDHSTGKLVKFYLLALRVLRGHSLPLSTHQYSEPTANLTGSFGHQCPAVFANAGMIGLLVDRQGASIFDIDGSKFSGVRVSNK
jgi:hypothetical protein